MFPSPVTEKRRKIISTPQFREIQIYHADFIFGNKISN